MKRESLAKLLTIAVMAAAVGFVAWRNTGGNNPFPQLPDLLAPATPAPEPSPQDAVYQMLDAAKEGDLERYLDVFGSQMQVNLRGAVAEMGEQRFLDSIKQTSDAIKGIAVMAPEKLSETAVKANVEYVYADRNEVQQVYLNKEEGRWRITRLDATERIPTLIPYGTPVQQE